MNPEYVRERLAHIAARTIETSEGCHLCSSNVSRGYSRVWFDGKNWRTHRLIWTLKKGPIPEGKVLDHLCGNRACCNPDHLEPVDPDENSRRAGIYGPPDRCKQGHEFTHNDINNRGHRFCRACDNERRRAKYAETHSIAA